MERVQKIIANAGYCSRRKAEELILQGRVKVNKKVVSIGAEADRYWDEIFVDGKKIDLAQKKYLLLNKPAGYVCSRNDPVVEKNIYQLIPEGNKLFSVGRLDVMSEGALLITNDGEFTNKVTHPRYGVEKEYKIILSKPFSQQDKHLVEKGITIDDEGIPYTVKGVRVKIEQDPRVIFFTLHEGKKRVIRRIMKMLGYGVARLIRVRIGRLMLGSLKTGEYRELTEQEAYSLASKKSSGK